MEAVSAPNAKNHEKVIRQGMEELRQKYHILSKPKVYPSALTDILFEKDFSNRTSLSKPSKIKKGEQISLFQINDDIRKNVDYQVSDFRQWVHEKSNFKRPCLLTLNNFLYNLKLKQQADCLQTLFENLKQGSIVQLHYYDISRDGYDYEQIMENIGFQNLGPQKEADTRWGKSFLDKLQGRKALQTAFFFIKP